MAAESIHFQFWKGWTESDFTFTFSRASSSSVDMLPLSGAVHEPNQRWQGIDSDYGGGRSNDSDTTLQSANDR